MAVLESMDPDALRTRLSQAMSNMYKDEVPLYADLLDIVKEVDDKARGRTYVSIDPS